MSNWISAVPSPPRPLPLPQQKTGKAAVERHCADYHPSIWGDYFLKYASNSYLAGFHEEAEKTIEKLKGEVKKKLLAEVKPSHKLDLIDQVQRLGIAYHFQPEIEKQLEEISETSFELISNGDLYTISLLFRLLREQGYKISCEIFNKFMGNGGKFNELLVADIQGMLSLYEACHLRVHGEDILDEALSFTMTHLELIDKNQVCHSLAKQVKHALKQPIRRGLPRLEACHYIPIYQEDPSHDEVLLSFAKLDFNSLQELHQMELSHITRWWKDLDVARNFPFSRDRIVECYFWILGVYFEPKYALARKITTKVIAICTILDDMYDAYGTLEELELFTQAIERWDRNTIDGLPEYMQLCYNALLDIYDEIGNDMAKRGTSFRLYYAIEAMKRQVRGYFAESKWFFHKHMPTFEEYLPVAFMTSAYGMLSTTSFVGMGDVATKEVFNWLSNDCNMVKAACVICRFMDDIVSHKFEQERGHVPSAVECFINQYNVTEQEAEKELQKQVVNAWKDLNQEFFWPNTIPAELLMRIFNFARVIDLLYTGQDNYTNSEANLKYHVKSLLVDPLPI